MRALSLLRVFSVRFSFVLSWTSANSVLRQNNVNYDKVPSLADVIPHVLQTYVQYHCLPHIWLLAEVTALPKPDNGRGDLLCLSSVHISSSWKDCNSYLRRRLASEGILTLVCVVCRAAQGLLSLYPVGAACAQWKIGGNRYNQYYYNNNQSQMFKLHVIWSVISQESHWYWCHQMPWF